MIRPFSYRTPKRSATLSWGRVPAKDGDFITWRLFRRDHRGALHMLALTYTAKHDRPWIAQQLRAARQQLRDRVDEIDLAAMGIAA